MTQGTRIFDGTYLRGTLYQGTDPEKPLIVGFEARDKAKTGFKDTGPIQSLWTQGHAILTLQSAANDWFINPDTTDLETAIATVARDHPPARLIGFSMGGYAAFRYARALNAAWVMAISPQVSIARDVVPWDKRYQAESTGWDSRLGDLGQVADNHLNGVIFFDPFRHWDLRHTRLIQQHFPNVRGLRLTGGGHPATKLLGMQNKIRSVIRTVAGDYNDALIPHIKHRAGRRRSRLYWDGLAKHSKHRFPKISAKATRKAAKLD